MSLGQLCQILKKQNLFCRYQKSNIAEVTLAVLQNLSGSSKSFGYRLMHQTLRADGFVVDCETVRMWLKILDGDGVELRTTYIIEIYVFSSTIFVAAFVASLLYFSAVSFTY